MLFSRGTHEFFVLDSDVHGDIVLLLDFAKAYDTLQRPYLISTLR